MGLELTNKQQKAFHNTIEDLNSQSIRYVVLRRHESLPYSIPGSQNKDYDIDILVDNNQYSEAGNVFRKNSFELGQVISGNLFSLGRRAIKQPRMAANVLTSSPSAVIGYISNAIRSTSDSEVADFHGHSCSFNNNEINMKLHVYNHLAHKSPMDGSRRRLEPVVENQVLDNRVKHNNIFVTAPPEELAHLICHCLFEYNGEFPRYYTDRCGELVDSINNNNEYEARFDNMLSNIFFKSSPIVKESSKNKEFSKILGRLYKHNDY